MALEKGKKVFKRIPLQASITNSHHEFQSTFNNCIENSQYSGTTNPDSCKRVLIVYNDKGKVMKLRTPG